MPRDPDYAGPPAPPAPAPAPPPVNPRTTYAAVNEGIDKTSLPGGFYLGATGGVRQYLPKEAYNAFVVQQAQQQSLLDRVLAGLATRSQSFPMSFVQDAPLTTMHLLTAPLDSYATKLIGDGLQSAYPWLKANGGVSGMLVGAYGNALQIQDPAERNAALTMVESLAQHTQTSLQALQEAQVRT